MDRIAYKVTFRWYGSDTFCTNICVADNEEAVRQHYAKHEITDLATGKTKHDTIVALEEATAYDIKSARERGMPIVVL